MPDISPKVDNLTGFAGFIKPLNSAARQIELALNGQPAEGPKLQQQLGMLRRMACAEH